MDQHRRNAAAARARGPVSWAVGPVSDLGPKHEAWADVRQVPGSCRTSPDGLSCLVSWRGPRPKSLPPSFDEDNVEAVLVAWDAAAQLVIAAELGGV